MCISKALLLAKEKKSKFKIKRKKTPFSPTPPQNNEKLSRLQILREAFFKGYITRKELGEGIEEIGL